MTPERDAAVDIARRIADGEAIDLSALAAEDPALARRLGRLQALARAMQPGAETGDTWGHLQQLQLAGQGGFGQVYRAYDPTLDRTVALKLRHERSDTLLPSGRDFVAEARRLARVRHPHVLAVHGASYHGGRAGLWADWIDGETLGARLRRDGALPRDELLRVLLELADAIDAVHQAGLVHGDITAGNVMLDARGRVILMDFGAGFESSDAGSQVTAGTPDYLAPEIVAGQPASAAVDLYAFGVLAHRLACNTLPVAARPSASLRPRGLRELIDRLLDANPAARPSADQARRRLQQLIDAPRVQARRWLLAAVALGLVGIALATAVGLRREQAQRRLAEHARDEATATASFLTEVLAAPAPESQGRDVRVVQLLDAAVKRANSEPGLSDATRAGLLLAIGRSQLALHQFRDADATLTQAWEMDTPAQPLPSVQARQIGLRLAHARTRRQHYPAAETVLQRIEQDPRWKDDAETTASVAIERASSLQSQGELERAEQMLAPVLARLSSLPAPLQVDALAEQARTLFQQGKAGEADDAARQALERLAATGEPFGVRQFELRMMRGNAATAQGNAVAGEAAYRALAQEVKQAYGDDAIALTGVWGNVAIALNEQGRYGESLVLLREWLPRIEAKDGPESTNVLALRSSFAVALHHGGDLPAALVEFDALVALYTRLYGETNPGTLIVRFNRVEALNDAGRHDEALQQATPLRVAMVEAMGEGHPFTLETDDAIGYALTHQARAREAEALHRRTVDAKTAVLGADNPFTLLAREYLARSLQAQGRRDEARALLEPLLQDRIRVLGTAHPKTATTRKLLARVDG